LFFQFSNIDYGRGVALFLLREQSNSYECKTIVVSAVNSEFSVMFITPCRQIQICRVAYKGYCYIKKLNIKLEYRTIHNKE